jgi:hypothetical protein
MNDLLLTLPVVGLAWWLGLYVIAREPRSPRLNRSGAGLLVYATAASADLLSRISGGGGGLDQLRWPLVLLPALFWIGALIALLPEHHPSRPTLDATWRVAIAPLTLALFLVGSTTGVDDGQPNGAALIVGGLLLGSMVIFVAVAWRSRSTMHRFDRLGVPLLFTIFLGMSMGLILLPSDLLPRSAILFVIGLDLLAIGFGIARFDALALGEVLAPDMVRSFDAALLASLVFGGQTALVMVFATGVTAPMAALLMSGVLAAITVTTLASPITGYLDRVAFRTLPQLRRNREELRIAASGLPRSEPHEGLRALDEATFSQVTRQALRYVGDLPRLASSPLIHHPAIDDRLGGDNAGGGPLVRAAALRALLLESIEQLKPDDGQAFATTSAWRHYNALYFPYVAGVKPYRRQSATTPLDPTARAALDWFRSDVPERTLYHWQNAASTLVAQDLRSHIRDKPDALPLTNTAPTKTHSTAVQRSPSD